MNLSLSTVLLFALLIPFIMTYRLSPGETPYLLFALIFLGFLGMVVIDMLNLSKKTYFWIKSLIFWLLIISTLGAGFASAIIVRHEVAPVFEIHDIILQQEAAIRFFLDGINPWATNYFGTHMESFHYSDNQVNPALYHFVMQPFYLVFSIPFYAVSIKTIGYFDGRMPLFFLFFITLIGAFIFQKNKEKKFQFVSLLAFNPATVAYLREGRSDFFMFAFLFISLALLQYKRKLLAAASLSLAFAVKQSVWPIFPFYVAYIYYKERSIKKIVPQIFIFAIIFLSVVGPFFLWNPKEFIESTVLYLSGNVEHAYPISGYGFGVLLIQYGFIKDAFSYYPFAIWQAVFAIPALVFLLKYLKKNTNIRILLISYTIFLFIFWYFSRYFNNSHIAYLSMLLITAYFWPTENEKKQKKEK